MARTNSIADHYELRIPSCSPAQFGQISRRQWGLPSRCGAGKPPEPIPGPMTPTDTNVSAGLFMLNYLRPGSAMALDWRREGANPMLAPMLRLVAVRPGHTLTASVHPGKGA